MPNCSGGAQVSTSYACVHVVGQGGEVVINPSGCSYIDGWPTSPVPGYAGICLGAAHDPSCDGTNHGNAPNNGGCFWIKGAPEAVNNALQNPVTAMLICRVDVGGDDPRTETRDGCSIPPDLCCSSRSVTSARVGAEKRNRGRD